MKKTTALFLLLYSLSFSSCDDDQSSPPDPITINMSCADAWDAGLTPDLECLSDTSALAPISMADYDGRKCVITLDYVTCDYCDSDGYSCSGE